MSIFNPDVHPRMHPQGNGWFSEKVRSAPEVTLGGPELPDVITGVHEDWEFVESVEHEGHLIHVSTEPDESAGEHFQVWGDPIVAEFWREPPIGQQDKSWLINQAKRVYDEKLLERARSYLGVKPELDGALQEEIRRIEARIRAKKPNEILEPGLEMTQYGIARTETTSAWKVAVTLGTVVATKSDGTERETICTRFPNGWHLGQKWSPSAPPKSVIALARRMVKRLP